MGTKIKARRLKIQAWKLKLRVWELRRLKLRVWEAKIEAPNLKINLKFRPGGLN